MSSPFVLDFKPGVQRDGTEFDSDSFLDALWCRWRLGKPRKMGGFKQITNRLSGVPRRIHCFYTGGNIIAHVGTVAGIQQVVFDATGALVSISDRTPPTFGAGANVGFTMDAIFDTTSAVVQLMVHAVPDTSALATTINTTPFIGQIDSTSPLAAFSAPADVGGGVWRAPSVSGGIVSVQPYAFDFSSDGNVGWSAPNLPLTLGVTQGSTGAGQARISAQKIVQGMPLRGGGSQSPAAIFWSLSEVITASFVGSASGTFAFNTVSPSSSILSSDGIIEYDGLYFWAGADRFLVFNGTVNEVPNKFNQDFFFDNLTPAYEARTFAFKVPRYGEIWWCACLFGATEPNWAVIYNLRENCWYDTPLPNGGRSAAYFAQGFRFPIMGGSVLDGTHGYKLWFHETGVDEVTGSTSAAIRSYFETGWFGGPRNTPPDDRGLSFDQFEPDIEQRGELSVTVIGAPNARTQPITGPTVVLPAVPSSSQGAFASFVPKQSLRLMRLRVESNVLGGNYIVGRNLGHGQPGDMRKFL